MNKLTGMLGAIVILLMMISCTEKKFVIEGEVIGAFSDKIYLKKNVKRNYIMYDSTEIVDGKFRFEGSVSEPTLYGLTTVKNSNYMQSFFLENALLNIEFNETDNKLVVKGSDINDQYMRNVSEVRKPGFSIDSLITAHPGSVVPAYFLSNTISYMFDLNQLVELRDKFDSSLDNSMYIKKLDNIIKNLSKVQVGSIAPDFILPDPDGNLISLYSYRGRYVLVDFWAGWCPDCRRENPNLVAAWNKYRDKNFDILGVSLDRDKETWLSAIRRDGLGWKQVSDLNYWDTAPAIAYAVRWVPMSFLIDPNGVILAVGLEGEALHQKLQELLE